MGNLGSIRLAAHGNQTPITPSNIYFLDNRFHRLATSQKVCDAWQRQSEARDRWHSAKRWSTRGSKRDSARKNWRSNSDITSRSWLESKAANAGLTSLSSSLCPVPLDLTRSRFWRSSKPPRSPTTKFERKETLEGAPFGSSHVRPATSRKNSQSTSTKCGMRCKRAP